MATPDITRVGGKAAPLRGFRSIYDPNVNVTYRVPLAEFAGAANPRSVAQRFLQRTIAAERGQSQAALRREVQAANAAANRPSADRRSAAAIERRTARRRVIRLPMYNGIRVGVKAEVLERIDLDREEELWQQLREWMRGIPWDYRFDVGLLWPRNAVAARKTDSDQRRPDGTGDPSDILERDFRFVEYLGRGTRYPDGGYDHFIDAVDGYTLSSAVLVATRVGTPGAPERG